MDQIKIGKFIAACRKEQGMTQAALAGKLGISDRAVSKWETGKSMPDSGIMLEVCEYLKINVNELLSGERIEMENYKEKAEENMVALQAKKDQAAKDLLKMELALLVFAILTIPAHLAINYYYPNNSNTGMGGIIVIAAVILFVLYFRKHYEIRFK